MATNTVKKIVPQRRSAMNFLSEAKAPEERPILVPWGDIYPDTTQPRASLHPLDGIISEKEIEELNLLADEILDNDLQQFPKVQPHPDMPGKWKLIFGERRWRAWGINLEAGHPDFDKMPVIPVVGKSNLEIRKIQLAENYQRKGLSDIEIASFMRLMLEEEPELQQKDLTDIWHMSKQEVSRYLGLLDPKYAELVNSGLITYATILENFKALTEEGQKRVVETARAAGKRVTSGMIKQERDNEKSSTVARSAPDRLDKSSVKTVNTSSKTSLSSLAVTQAVTHQEVHLQLRQLQYLLPLLKEKNSIDASITLDVETMRGLIRSLGNQPTSDATMLATELINALNKKMKGG